MKKYSMMLVSTLLVVALTACGESTIEPVEKESDAATAAENETDSSENESNKTDGNSDEATEETNEDANTEVFEEDLGIGETINFDGVHITLNGVRTSEGEEYFEPDNDFFLILDLTADNTTDEAANISTMLQMSLVDPNGYGQDMDIFADTKGSLDGEVGAGRKMAGEISFDVEDKEYFEFIFENPFSSGQAIWKINRADWE